MKDVPDCKPYVKSDKSPEVEFVACDFSYSPCKPLLKEVSFKIAAGTTTALVGRSVDILTI